MSKATRIEQFLAFFTRKIIAKYQPMVIGITGSVGKTSTRHAIAAALSSKYHLREPEKNYNNLIGIPLTVIGAHGIDGTTSWFGAQLGWLRIFIKAIAVWLLPQNYPKLLVLEYGIDHPGDMDDLLNLVKPNLAVLTSIGVSHLENFASQAELATEKAKIASWLKPGEPLIYNADDSVVASQVAKLSMNKFSFGTQQADVILKTTAEKLQLNPSTTLDFQTPTREIKLTIPVVGMAHVMAVSAAVAVAESLQEETDLLQKGLASYKAMPGRLNILAGIKKTILIDDTYNAAPASTLEALHLLSRFPGSNKIAVLGDMLELGDQSETAHSDIGKLAASMHLQKLITVGNLGAEIATNAVNAGMPADQVLVFNSSAEAASKVLELLVPESVVLIKGSQGARMEKITKELLAEPTAAGHLLVRQYGKWLSN